LRAARGRDPVATVAPVLLVGHGPLRAARGRDPVATVAPVLLVGHGPLRAACGRDPAVAAKLRWTCQCCCCFASELHFEVA
jgi:hypothetical protein